MTLALAGIGVANASVAEPLGTTVAAGVHLRWSFSLTGGLPWFGYWLLRRNSGQLRPGLTEPDPAGPWQLLPGVKQPIGLPLWHASYPVHGAQPPGSPSAWQTFGKTRVLAGNATALQAGFAELTAALEQLVAGGPNSTMEAVSLKMLSGTAPNGDTQQAPALQPRPILNWLQLAALDPGMAQLLGLYVVDTSASLGVAYDYAVVADFDHQFSGAAVVLGWAEAGMAALTGVDRAQVNGLTLANAPNLPAPTAVSAYFLPRGSIASPNDPAAMASPLGLVGLRWQPADVVYSASAPKAAKLLQRFVMLRQYLAAADDESAPPLKPDAWQALPVGEPIALVTGDGQGSLEPKPPADWPPTRMMAIDQPPSEGWFAYAVVAIDLFGRASAPSTSAAWCGWDFAPGAVPWYAGKVGANGVVDAAAIRVLNKIPPPPPVGLAAELLDPADPYALKAADVKALSDAEASALFLTPHSKAEFLAKSGGVCVRLRWSWRWQQARQAPQTKDFRVYWRKGRFNTWTGAVVQFVADASNTGTHKLTVKLDAESLAAEVACPLANAFLGRSALIDGQAWRIGTGLAAGVDKGERSFTVTLISATALDMPQTGARVTLTLAPPTVDAQSAACDPSDRVHWDDRLCVIPYDDPKHCVVRFAVSQRAGAPKDAPEAGPLQGAHALVGAGGDWVLLSGTAAEGKGPSALDNICVGAELLWLKTPGTSLAAACRAIVNVDRATGSVQVAGALPKLNGAIPWAIGEIVRDYETFVAPPQLAAEPPEATGIQWHSFGVSAADDRKYSGDAAGQWGPTGGLKGNEGRVAAAVPVVRVQRTPPAAPLPWVAVGPVYASPVDAHGFSYHTFRWLQADAKSNGQRIQVLRALDEALYVADWRQRPRKVATAAEPRFKALVAELKLPEPQLTAIANVLDTIEGVSPPKAGTSKVLSAKARAIYDSLEPLALQALAALPGMDQAFVAVTAEPLKPAECLDKAGIDDDAAVYKPAANSRAYQAQLPGNCSQSYVFCARAVDLVGNVSEFGLPATPVTVKNTRAPLAPMALRSLPVSMALTVAPFKTVAAKFVAAGKKGTMLLWQHAAPDGLNWRVVRSNSAVGAQEEVIEAKASEVTTADGWFAWVDAKAQPPASTTTYRIAAVRDGLYGSPLSQPLRVQVPVGAGVGTN